MHNVTIGELYDNEAARLTSQTILGDQVYECRFCDTVKLTGKEVIKEEGKSHAIAHRIAFESLLEPSLILCCPFCDVAVQQSSSREAVTCNDLDMVNHLETEHPELLGDVFSHFSTFPQLLTNYQVSTRMPKLVMIDLGTGDVDPQHRPDESSITNCRCCKWSTSTPLPARKQELSSHVVYHLLRHEMGPELSRNLRFYIHNHNTVKSVDNYDKTFLEISYKQLLVRLFGVSYPLVYRILHPGLVDVNFKYYLDVCNNEFECMRVECGHEVLPLKDYVAICRHVCAHIRHDEFRLLKKAKYFFCACMKTIRTPAYFFYHVIHDHLFQNPVFEDVGKILCSSFPLIFESVLRSCADRRTMQSIIKLSVHGLNLQYWSSLIATDPEDGRESNWATTSKPSESWFINWNVFLKERAGFFRTIQCGPFEAEHPKFEFDKVPLKFQNQEYSIFMEKVWQLVKEASEKPIDPHSSQAQKHRWQTISQRKHFIPRQATCTLDKCNCTQPTVSNSVEDGGSRDHEATKNEVTLPSRETKPPDSNIYFQCTICEGVYYESRQTHEMTMHKALHAVMEARYLCQLYIHREKEILFFCPFCGLELLSHSPSSVMIHLRCHPHEVLTHYNTFFKHMFQDESIFSHVGDDWKASPRMLNKSPMGYSIRCFSAQCNHQFIYMLYSDNVERLVDFDNFVLEHIIWHLDNDPSLDLTDEESAFMKKVLTARLTTTSHLRQLHNITKKVLKQHCLLLHETEVVKYVHDKLEEIGTRLFRRAKGIVFMKVFPRKAFRHLLGPGVYPPCVCVLCMNEGMLVSERKRLIFVAHVFPMITHTLEHMNAYHITRINHLGKTVCPMDGFVATNFMCMMRHLLHVHPQAIGMNLLRPFLEKMNIFKVFDCALDTAFGDQSWQIKEVLGFSVFDPINVPRISFFDTYLERFMHTIDPLPAPTDDKPELKDVKEEPSPPPERDLLPDVCQSFYQEFLQSEQKLPETMPELEIEQALQETPIEVKQEIKEEVVDDYEPMNNNKNDEMPVLSHVINTVPQRQQVQSIVPKLVCYPVKQVLKRKLVLSVPNNVPIRRTIPLKKTLHGSKMVAAALGEALGTPLDKTNDDMDQQRYRMNVPTKFIIRQPTAHKVDTLVYPTKAEETASAEPEESDLTLGCLSKTVTPKNDNTPPKKRLASNKRKQSLASLLNGDQIV